MSRSPRKRSKSRRRSLRRRSDDGPSDDDSGAAEPRDFQEDRRDPGRRGFTAQKAAGSQVERPGKINRKKRGGEGPQEPGAAPRGVEPGPTKPEKRREG